MQTNPVNLLKRKRPSRHIKKEKKEVIKEEAAEDKKETTKVFGEELKAGVDEDDEDTVDEADAPPTLFKQDLVKNSEVIGHNSKYKT